MKFRSLRPYPITLTNPRGENVVVYPGQVIDLPEQFGLLYSGLLVKVEEAKEEVEIIKEIVEEKENKVEIIKEEVKDDVKEVEEDNLVEVEIVVENTEPPKKKAGRPKKNA